MSFTTESGISNIGKIPWGSHFCHLYENAADLAEVLIPYFAQYWELYPLCLPDVVIG